MVKAAGAALLGLWFCASHAQAADSTLFRQFSEICLATRSEPIAVKNALEARHWQAVDPKSLPAEKLTVLDGLKDYTLWVRFEANSPDAQFFAAQGYMKAGSGGNACTVVHLTADPQGIRDGLSWIGPDAKPTLQQSSVKAFVGVERGGVYQTFSLADPDIRQKLAQSGKFLFAVDDNPDAAALLYAIMN